MLINLEILSPEMSGSHLPKLTVSSLARSVYFH